MQLPNSFVAPQLWDGGGPLELHAPTRSNYQVKRENTYNRGPPHRFLNTRFYYPGPQIPPQLPHPSPPRQSHKGPDSLMMSSLLFILVFRIHQENKEIFDRLVTENEEFLLTLQNQTPVDKNGIQGSQNC